MSVKKLRPCGDYRTSYSSDMSMFQDKGSYYLTLAGIVFLSISPFVFDSYIISLLIYIGFYGIAALGLNILVGCTGQISVGHAVFFGFGAFASAWLSNKFFFPVWISIPLAAIFTAIVGLIFGIPAARVKGLYLAIATLAAQFIMEDFFSRAAWFTGGVDGASAEPLKIFNFYFDSDQRYFYVVLFWLLVSFILATNLMRTRDGRAFLAVRDHYLSAEMMGINLMKYRILSFGISSFFAGLGGALYGHYLSFVSIEEFNIQLSIFFLAMIIIGGLGSVRGSLMGAAFMVLLPEVMDYLTRSLAETSVDQMLSLSNAIPFIKEASIGLVIILFLIFEPNGLAYRWGQIRAWFKLYPFSY
ncbi:MAG: branched-chain amino acid ABC transporter permease [Pseudomonadota bacterium]|nr:branched-chain amino acid ABC transporter permease [Pseudomonadota bacterium]